MKSILSQECIDRFSASYAEFKSQDDTRLVTVCASCFTASCWHGEFMCNDSRHADITQKSVAELDELHREHPDNYCIEKIRKVCGGEPS